MKLPSAASPAAPEGAAGTEPVDGAFPVDPALVPPTDPAPKKRPKMVDPEEIGHETEHLRTLFYFEPDSPHRTSMRAIANDPRFKQLIIVLILCGCVLLAMKDPTGHKGDRPTFELVLKVFDLVSLAIFCVEGWSKLVVCGFAMHSGAFLWNPWNVLDMIVIAAGIAQLILPYNLAAAKMLRVFRLLKVVRAVPGIRMLVDAIASAMPDLGNVFILCGFIFFVFGIIGIMLFNGKMHQRCFDGPTRTLDESTWRMCNGWPGENEWRHVLLPKDNPLRAQSDQQFQDKCGGSGGRCCPAGQYCGITASPHQDMVNFDNIMFAMLTIFTIVTLEGWTDNMYMIADAYSPYTNGYFVLAVFSGSFFLLNLLMAVLWDKYSEAIEQAFAEKARQAELRRYDVAFSQVDLDGSGEISVSELGVAMDAAGLKLTVEEIEVMVAEADEDGSGEISFEEFVEIVDGTRDDPRWQVIAEATAEEVVVKPTYGYGGRKMYKLATGELIENVIFCMIILNTGAMAAEHYEQPQDLTAFLSKLNLFFTVIFTSECAIKILGVGFWVYLEDPLNQFDFFIVTTSLLELIPKLLGLSSGGGFFSMLKAFRLFRCFKLMMKIPNLKKLLLILIATINDLVYFNCLLCLVMAIYALIGMDMFGGKFFFTLEDGSEYYPRSNFDSFGKAFVTVFQVLSGENWNECMYEGVRAGLMLEAVGFFVSMVVFGNFILFNLFLAMLLGAFANDPEPREDSASLKEARTAFELYDEDGSGSVSTAELKLAFRDAGVKMAEDDLDDLIYEADEDGSGELSLYEFHQLLVNAKSVKGEAAEQLAALTIDEEYTTDEDTPLNNARKPPQLHPLYDGEVQDGVTMLVRRRILGKWYRRRWTWHHKSCFTFAPDHPFRMTCQAIHENAIFSNIVMAAILVGSVMIAFENPLHPNNAETTAIFKLISNVFTVLFVVEMLLCMVKVCVLIAGPGETPYLCDGWNILDFILVALSLVGFVMDASSLRSLRALRALRALRMVKRFKGMKMVVNSIISAIPGMCDVVLVDFLIFLIFAILGVQLFGGRFHFCEGSPSLNRDRCHGSINVSGVATPLEWVNPEFHFDSVPDALLTLFEMSTLEGWPGVMAAGVDITSDGMAPRRDASLHMAGFFVIFVIVGAFLCLNLFVGVVCDSFTQTQKENDGSAFLTPEQLKWRKIQTMATNSCPEMVYESPNAFFRGHRVILSFDWLRMGAFNFITTNWFEETKKKKRKGKPPRAGDPVPVRRFSKDEDPTFDTIIMVVIIVNIGFMSTQHWRQEEWVTTLQGQAGIVFAIIFTGECIVKLLAYGSMYFWDNWNRFDFVLVTASMAGRVFENKQLALVVRLLRVARIFRLVKYHPPLAKILQTLILSFPSMANVCNLLVVLLYVFACIGMNLFAFVPYGDFLHEHANFRSVSTAFMTLLRCATGESWNEIMRDATVSSSELCAERCASDLALGDTELGSQEQCEFRCVKFSPGFAGTYFFFYVFTVVIAFMFLNLFIALILENFGGGEDEEHDVCTTDDAANFASLWTSYKNSLGPYLDVNDFRSFLKDLPEPLGMNGKPAADITECKVIMEGALRLYPAPGHNEDNGQQFYFYEDVFILMAQQRLKYNEDGKIKIPKPPRPRPPIDNLRSWIDDTLPKPVVVVVEPSDEELEEKRKSDLFMKQPVTAPNPFFSASPTVHFPTEMLPSPTLQSLPVSGQNSVQDNVRIKCALHRPLMKAMNAKVTVHGGVHQTGAFVRLLSAIDSKFYEVLPEPYVDHQRLLVSFVCHLRLWYRPLLSNGSSSTREVSINQDADIADYLQAASPPLTLHCTLCEGRLHWVDLTTI